MDDYLICEKHNTKAYYHDAICVKCMDEVAYRVKKKSYLGSKEIKQEDD